MHVKDIKATVARVKAVSVGVGGFIGRHKRASIAVGAALLLRRFARPNGRQRTGRTQQATRAHQARQTARATQHEATVLKVKSNDRRPSESGHARASHA